MARTPRRGKGSDKSTDEGKINNSVSSSDGKSDAAYTPSAPKPPQPPKNGRTDLNGPQGFRRAQEIANHTTPQMGRKERAAIEAMKVPAPEPSSPAPGMGMGMGMGSSFSEEDPRNASITDEQLKALARQYVDAENAKNEQSDYSWMSDTVGERFSDAVEFEKAADAYRNRVDDLAGKLTLEQVNSFSVEGYTVDDGVSRLHGDKGLIVTTIAGTEQKLKVDPADLQVVIAERLGNEPADTPQRWAAFLPLENDERLQFTDSSMSYNKAAEQMLHLKGVLIANDEKVIADRLRVFDLTDDEIKAERMLPPHDQPRHERAFEEAAQREFSSLSNPSLSGKDHVAVADAYDNAPKPAAEDMVRRDDVVDRSPEGLQKHANRMFEEGRDLRDIHADTKMKPEGADKTAWEKTEYVYGQPTALDRLQEMGKGGFAVSESGYTYAMSADGASLLRFDIDGNPAGQKPVEDVQAFLQQQRGIEFDQQQQAKEMHAAELAEQVAKSVEKPEADQSDEAKLVTNEHEAEDKHIVEAANEEAVDLTQKAPEVETSLDTETEASRGHEREQSGAPVPQEAAAVEEAASKAEATPEMAPQVEPEQSVEITPEVSAQPEVSVNQEPKSEINSELPSDVASEASNEVAPEIMHKQDQEHTSVSEPEASPEVGPAISEQQSADASAENVPANQNKVAKDVTAEQAAEVRQDPSAELSQQPQPVPSKADEAVLDQGQPQDGSAGAAPELSPSKTNTIEEDNISDLDQKLDAPEAPQQEMSYFQQYQAELRAKDQQAQAAPEVSQEKAATVEAQPEAKQEAPQPEAQPEKSVYQSYQAEQQEKAQQPQPEPQISEEEERRRGPGLEAA